MKHSVLLVDDDTVLTKQYKMALELAGLKCIALSSIASLTEYDIGSFEVIVLDLMMPAEGEFAGKDHEDGLLTGVRVAETIRTLGFKNPIIVYTNLNIDGILKIAERVVEPLTDVIVVKKFDFSPVDLAAMVSATADGSAISNLAPSLRQRILDSVIIAPSFHGISVDLKKLFFGR